MSIIHKDYKVGLPVQDLVLTKATKVSYKVKDYTLLKIVFKFKMELFKMWGY